MRGFNKVIICGNVGGEPSIRQFDNGNKVVEVNVATNEGGYTNSQGKEIPEVTQWHRVECFGRNAEFAGKYVKKGTCILVEGRINYRTYTDKNNQQQKTTEIIAERVEMMGNVNTTTDDNKTRENENLDKITAYKDKVQGIADAFNMDVQFSQQNDLPF